MSFCRCRERPSRRMRARALPAQASNQAGATKRPSSLSALLHALASGKAVAVYTAFGAVGTCLAALLVAYQVRESNANERVNRANAAVWQFSFSAELQSVRATVRDKSKSGRDYSCFNSEECRDAKVALITLTNALDTIAAGVLHCAYDEQVAFRSLARFVYKTVQAHIHARSNVTVEVGGPWIAAKEPIFPVGMEQVRRLYARWFPDDEFSLVAPRHPPSCG